MRFRFAQTLKKYEVSYTLIRTKAGDWDADGIFDPEAPVNAPRRGAIQPLGAKYLQTESGRYTSDDRALYTIRRHDNGDVIEYLGVRYTVQDADDRSEYCDAYKYVLQRVSTHDQLS